MANNKITFEVSVVPAEDLRYAMGATMLHRIDQALKQSEAELLKHARRIEGLLVERKKIVDQFAKLPFAEIELMA